jgi:hypothetical protein
MSDKMVSNICFAFVAAVIALCVAGNWYPSDPVVDRIRACGYACSWGTQPRYVGGNCTCEAKKP